MSKLTCVRSNEEMEQADTLPQRIACQIENLRQERIEDYTKKIQSDLPHSPTRLERSVDTLLDSLNNLHYLEQLAAHVAAGGQITVEADRNLIAANEETYLALLNRYAAQFSRSGVVVSALLPSSPRPVEYTE